MNKWNYDEDRLAFCDGTGNYSEGYYFADQAAYECGTEPVQGPFATRQEAIEARDAEEQAQQALDIAERKTGYDREKLKELLDQGETLSIATGRDGKQYVWWLDDASNWAVRLDEEETELTEQQIDEQFA